MKKAFALLLALLMTAALLTACAEPAATVADLPEPALLVTDEVPEPEPEAEPVELIVFAAASMTEAMNEIAALYKDVAPDVTIVYNFDSSGTLKTQIEEGAECDLFISAGQKQMNQLDISADAAVNTDGLDFVLAGSRFDLVRNKVVMIVPEGTDLGITAFADVLGEGVRLIALGNSDVPAGQYAEEVYTSLGLWEELVASGKVSYGSNVKEVLEQVASAAVDCGVVYSTDAATASGVTVAAEAPEGSHGPIVYPAAVLNISKNQAAAEAFAEFLRSDACAAVFESIGFSIPERQNR